MSTSEGNILPDLSHINNMIHLELNKKIMFVKNCFMDFITLSLVIGKLE